jgi:hypothetical protein
MQNGAEIKVGETLVCNVYPTSGVTLTCDGTTVSKTDSSITCTSNKAGTLLVSAKDSSYTTSVMINVVPNAEVGEITLSNCSSGSINMFAGSAKNLGATPTGVLKYESANNKVVTIDSNGNVNAISSGEATVTVSNASKTVTKTCTVTVVTKACTVDPTCPSDWLLKTSGTNKKCFHTIPSTEYKGCTTGVLYKMGTVDSCGTEVKKICPYGFSESCEGADCTCVNSSGQVAVKICIPGSKLYNGKCYLFVAETKTTYICSDLSYEYSSSQELCVRKIAETANYIYICPKGRTYNGSGCVIKDPTLKAACEN